MPLTTYIDQSGSDLVKRALPSTKHNKQKSKFAQHLIDCKLRRDECRPYNSVQYETFLCWLNEHNQKITNFLTGQKCHVTLFT